MALKSKSMDAVRLSVPIKEVQKDELVRVNLNVPESTRQRWKLAAIERKTTVGELIVQAMEAHLNK